MLNSHKLLVATVLYWTTFPSSQKIPLDSAALKRLSERKKPHLLLGNTKCLIGFADCYNIKTQNTVSWFFCSEVSKFIHFFIHSFIQHTFTEHLPRSRQGSGDRKMNRRTQLLPTRSSQSDGGGDVLGWCSKEE